MKSEFVKSVFKPVVMLTTCVLLLSGTARAEESSESISTDGWSVESLVPLFFYGGYHFAVGYRRDQFRVRGSVIYSGNYDAEPNGLQNNAGKFSRYYDTGSAGVFFDYFPFLEGKWIRGIHVFGFVEHHNWKIQAKSNNEAGSMQTWDAGPGIGYQLFLWDGFYIQPGYHHYFRQTSSINVAGQPYTIPAQDSSFVFRIGWQF